MKIDKPSPQRVGDKDSLKSRMIQERRDWGVDEEIKDVISSVAPKLLQAVGVSKSDL